MKLREAVAELEQEWGMDHSNEIEQIASSVSGLQD